jgi:hypothetical protein
MDRSNETTSAASDDWLILELRLGIVNCKAALAKTDRGDIFWGRYWDGYLKGYETLLEKTLARGPKS